jgi:antirestriction protein ArdC
MSNNKVYEIVGKQLLEAIEKDGLMPWRMPWAQSAEILGIHNYTSKHEYRGSNTLMLPLQLWLKDDKEVKGNTGRRFPQADTFIGQKDATNRGLEPVNGYTWADYVCCYYYGKFVPKENKGNEDAKQIPVFKFYKVYPDYVFGLESKEPKAEIPKVSVEDACFTAQLIADQYIKDSGVRLTEGGNRAYYEQVSDRINMPELSQFKTQPYYFDTLFHEMCHSTGSDKRLKRELRTEKKSYAKEELVAEIGAAYLCGRAGISSEELVDNSAAYLKGWVQAIKDDPKAVVSAMSKALHAVAYITKDEEQSAAEAA